MSEKGSRRGEGGEEKNPHPRTTSGGEEGEKKGEGNERSGERKPLTPNRGGARGRGRGGRERRGSR